ncbi:hypothetical protein RvY_08894 [Ramazzottius varieornatus]|uniref:MSL3 chromodomain-like domain-containing protein n=1 Tax=Ramazzottius varieornatus TaxID=947166 RepID=A0A1D1VGM4_RAMVA|nr:hypothetical protein RvY_08894 [Ramazzottius varieornatus]
MDKTSTCSAPSHGGIPPPIMTINPAPSTPNRNMKKELNDHTEMRLEDFMKKFSIGDDVWVISKGQWHEAKLILIETYKYSGDETTSVPIYRIHYPGWGKRYDEWMYSDSLMLQNTENNAKASAENGALMEASGIKSMKTGKRTAQADRTSSLQMTAEKANVFQSSNPVPINGVSPARGRGKGGSRGGATAEPRGTTSSKQARIDAGLSAGDNILAAGCQSLEPPSMASALECELTTLTDNGKAHSLEPASSSEKSINRLENPSSIKKIKRAKNTGARKKVPAAMTEMLPVSTIVTAVPAGSPAGTPGQQFMVQSKVENGKIVSFLVPVQQVPELEETVPEGSYRSFK